MRNSRKGAVSTLKAREEKMEKHEAQENNFFEESKEPCKHFDQVAANNMIIDANNFPTDINIVDKEDLMFHQQKLLQKCTKEPPKKKAIGENNAYRRALDEIEHTIAFNDAAVLDEADDSLCTDESMNDIG